MVIRSFRRVFELERRIYRIDNLRLNPGGVPVRALGYFLILALGCLLAARVPLLGYPLARAPWYLRDLALPALAAAGVAALRVDGRPGHLAVSAIVRGRLGPRYLIGGRVRRGQRARWWPPDVVLLADAADGRPRRMRGAGPGEVTILAEHDRVLSARMRTPGRSRTLVTIGVTRSARRPRARRLISLPATAELEVVPRAIPRGR